jgi:tRNA(Ile)-lysidine synthase
MQQVIRQFIMHYPSDIHREVHQFLRTYCPTFPLRILLGISGGADSVALAMVLHELSTDHLLEIELHLAHFNHQLRGAASDADEDFVQQFAAHYKLPLQVMRQPTQTLATTTNQNLEALARQLRYDFFALTAQKICATAVATAHNLNDQAETFLLRLLRGSGRQGLTAIAPYRPLFPGTTIKLLRPLLKVSRTSIETFLAQRQINYCHDQSNLNLKYARNRLRHEVLPLLATFNPNIVTTLARTADILQQDFSPLLPSAQPQSYLELPIIPLQQATAAVRYQQLRQAINKVQGHLRRITHQHLMAIEHLLLPGKSGKQLALPQGLIVKREFEKLIIWKTTTAFDRFPSLTDKAAAGSSNLSNSNITNLTVSKKNFVKPKQLLTYDLALGESQIVGALSIAFLPLQLQSEMTNQTMPFQTLNNVPVDLYQQAVHRLAADLPKNYYAVVDQQITGNKLQIRFRQPGDRYHPGGHQKPQKLKQLWQEYRIPHSTRDSWPVITTIAGDIIWLPGLPLATEVIPNATTTHFAIILAK